MRNQLLYFILVFSVSALVGQNQVDPSELIFERTESKGAVYLQYAATTKLSAETNQNDKIELDLGAGYAEVVQSQDDRLKVKAEIVISVKNKKRISKELEDMELYIEKNGSSVKLVSTFDYQDEDNNFSGGFLSSPERKINIKIYIPKSLDIRLKDRSGDLKITDVTNNFRLTDGSGSIKIDGLNGNLDLHDNSGDIEIDGLNQQAAIGEDFKIKIRDSSGSLFLKNSNGNTEIDDSSGDIEVYNLGGSLEIDDTSGRIDAKKIGGDSKVIDTSGDISFVSVEGNVTISDTSGGIYIDTVSRDVTLKRDGSGSFTTKNVQGNIVKRS